MGFDFKKKKEELEDDDWFFKKSKSQSRTDWLAKKQTMFSKKNRLFSIFEKKPNFEELDKFIKKVIKLDDNSNFEEVLFIAPDYDKYAFDQLIDKSGLLKKRRLKKLIVFKKSDSSLQVPRSVRKQIVEEEMKKPKVVKKMVKATDDYKIFRKICLFAKKFETTPYMLKKEMDVEQNFLSYLKAKFGKREDIIYEKARATGRFDIYLPKRRIAIEFKLLNKKSDLHGVVGQVFNYQDDYDYMLAVLVNVKNWPRSELINAEKRMKSLGNVDVIIK